MDHFTGYIRDWSAVVPQGGGGGEESASLRLGRLCFSCLPAARLGVRIVAPARLSGPGQHGRAGTVLLVFVVEEGQEGQRGQGGRRCEEGGFF